MSTAHRYEEDNEPNACIACGGKSTDERDFQERDGERYCQDCAEQFDKDMAARTPSLTEDMEFLGAWIDDQAQPTHDAGDELALKAWGRICEAVKP